MRMDADKAFTDRELRNRPRTASHPQISPIGTGLFRDQSRDVLDKLARLGQPFLHFLGLELDEIGIVSLLPVVEQQIEGLAVLQ